MYMYLHSYRSLNDSMLNVRNDLFLSILAFFPQNASSHTILLALNRLKKNKNYNCADKNAEWAQWNCSMGSYEISSIDTVI